jgi:hypothetical protein
MYRCHECGWRGRAITRRPKSPEDKLRTIAIWIVGLLFAIAVGFFSVELLR